MWKQLLGGLGKSGLQSADDIITRLGPAAAMMGGDIQAVLRQFGRQIGRVAPTARESVEAGARGVFQLPAQPAVQQGAQSLYKMGAEAAQPAAAQVTQAVSRAEPSIMGVFKPPAQAALRRAAAAAPTPPAAPVATAAEVRVPLEGRQLDLFSGFNRLTNPKGAVTEEGFKIGGTTFNPADVMPEGAYTQRIRELARSKGVPEELFIEQMTKPGQSLAEVVDFAAIQPRTGLMSGPVEFGTYQARNLIRNNMGNLAELVRTNPRLAAAAGLTGVAGAAGLYAATRPGATEPETPLETPMGPTTESVDVGGLVNDPQAAQNRAAAAAQELAAAMDPSARAVIPTADYTGAGGQTRITTRGENEALTAAKQQYTKPQQQLQQYMTQREAYAKFPANTAEIVSELSKRGVLDTPQLVTWAQSNPTLAYELLRKATGSNVLPSQQVPQQTQKTIMAPAGSNNANNMIGNTQSTAEAAVGGTQGASDLRTFTEGQLVDEIRQLDPALIYALQGRNLI